MATRPWATPTMAHDGPRNCANGVRTNGFRLRRISLGRSFVFALPTNPAELDLVESRQRASVTRKATIAKCQSWAWHLGVRLS